MTDIYGLSATSLTDPTKQQEIYNYLNALKKDENGWRRSVQRIVSGEVSNQEEHFLLLQVVEDFLQKRYSNSLPTDNQIIKEFLFNYVKNIENSSTAVPIFVINKMAHIFSLVFAADFPEKWPTFFNDLFFNRNLTEPRIATFYLKVLLDIDSTVVDRDIQRSKSESERNVKIKDAMREICVNQIAESWLTISNSVDDDTIQCFVLESIASYVDWIELDLVANDTVMMLIISRLQKSTTSEAAANAVCGLLEKGMPAEKKVGLALTLVNVLRSNGLMTVTADSDEDEVVRVGSLVNTIGLVLLDVHQKLVARSILEKEQACCLAELAAMAEPAIMILSNEDIELSELTTDFLRSYVTFLIKFDTNCSAIMEKVVQVSLTRYVMEDGVNVDGGGEEVDEHQAYRKELRSLLNVIGSKNPEMIIAALEPWVVEVTSRGSQLSINKVEAILNFIYYLHEIIPSNLLQIPRDGLAERAVRLPLAILEGLALDGRSNVVHVMFFEIACRYDRLLASHSQPMVVPQIAAAFLDQRGIAIPAEKYRTRIVYLFCRFVKSHKAVLSSLVSEVISRIAPLLAVSPLVESDELLSSDDQAYIFEATATLIASGDLTGEQKAQYLGELTTSLAIKFENSLMELNAARAQNASEESIGEIEAFMKKIVTYCCRMSKAFVDLNAMKACNCVEIYTKLIKLFIGSLTPQNAFLLESTRQLAHRLVVSMEGEIMPYMREIFEKLALVSTDLDSMHHLLIFCHQVVARFKKDMLQSGVDLANVLLIAAKTSMQDQENIMAAKDDSQRALTYVQRAFLQLLNTVIVSDCVEALSTTPGLLDHVLEAAARLALSTDQTSQKVAISCLGKVSRLYPAWSSRTLRIALEIPSLAHITPADAGSTIVVHEVCVTLTALFQADPNGFTQALRELLPNGFSDQLLNALMSLKGRNLDKEVMNIYSAVRAPNGQAH